MEIHDRKLIALLCSMFFLINLSFAKPIDESPKKIPDFEVFSRGIPTSEGMNSPISILESMDNEDLGYFYELQSWDFETGDAWTPELRRGSSLPAGAYWQASSWGGYNGTNSWWCGVNAPAISYNGYDNNWLQFLETPVLDLTSAGTAMTFQFMMKAYLEGGAYHPDYDSWDACNVWYSLDGGGTWTVLPNPSLAYNSSSDYAFGQGYGYYYNNGSSMIGTPVPGWYGNVTGGNYVPVSFDVSGFINETSVKFRFGFASDASESASNYSAYIGMLVDDILIYDNVGTTFLSNNADGVAIPSDLIPIAQYEPEWELTESSANSATHSWHLANDLNVNHALRSPSFFVPSGLPTYLSYHVWCDMPDAIGTDNGNLDDYYRIMISINNGVSWYSLTDDWSTRPSPDGPSLEGWKYRNQGFNSNSKLIDLTPYAGYNVRIKFQALSDFDDDAGVGTGFYVDDVSVFQYEGFHDYVWEPTEYNWIELADDPEAQKLTVSNSGQYFSIDMVTSHSFQMLQYDEIWNQIYINANGAFYVRSSSPTSVPDDLSSTSYSSGAVAPFWANLDYSDRDEAAVYVKNVEGNLIIEWFMPHIESDPDWPLAFQAHLFPDGRIEYHYQLVPDPIGTIDPLVIGVNNRNCTKRVELTPEMGYLPSCEMAVALIPGMPSYGSLEVTVIDQDLGLPVPDLELYLEELSQYANTDANGVATFTSIPIHEHPTVEVGLSVDHYIHGNIFVDLIPDFTVQAEIQVQALLNPVRNVVVNNSFDDKIELSWDPPNSEYSIDDLGVFESDSMNSYSFEYEGVAQGMDFSIYEMNGYFDLESVEVYLINDYGYSSDITHMPPIEIQVWDMTNPSVPTSLFSTMYQPTEQLGWFTIPIGLVGLDSPKFAITVSTPEQSGDMAYNLWFDSENDYSCDLILYPDGVTEEPVVLGGMPGDPLMAANIRYCGEYELVAPNPSPTHQAAFDAGSGAGKEVRKYRTGMYMGTLSAPFDGRATFEHSTVGHSVSIIGSDAYTGDVAYYRIYRDDSLIDSTADDGTTSYLDSGVDEAIAYTYEIAPVYNSDTSQVEGVRSEQIVVSPVMHPNRPDGGEGVEIANETIDGGDLTINWDAPTTNEDGTPLTDLTGYNIYMDFDLGTLIAQASASDTTWTLNVSRGYHNVYLTAVDEVGYESDPWIFPYHWVGVADVVFDFEADDGGLSGVGFEYGAPAAGPASGYDGSANLWGTNLDGYYENETLYKLDLPSLRIGAENSWITFWQWYDFELGYDGGIVAVSTDIGQTWNILDLAQDETIYEHTYLGSSYSNPLTDFVSDVAGVISGQSSGASTATPEGWVMRGVNLGEYAGQDVLVSFIAGTDAGNNLHNGWYVDNLSFCDVTFIPSLFSLIGPLNSDTCWTLDTTLVWHSATDPDPGEVVFYDVWVDTLANMSTAQLVADSSADTAFSLTDLLDDHNYYWTVRATDSNTSGTWADQGSFTTYCPEAPETFALLAPADGADVSMSELSPVVFHWQAATDPDPGDTCLYTLELALDEQFSTPITVDAGIADSVTLESLEQNTYYWRVRATDRYGFEVLSSGTWTLSVSLSVADDRWAGMPTEYCIAGLYPNPFNPSLSVVVGLPDIADLRVTVYNVMGRKVDELANGRMQAGYQTFSFDGSRMSSGIYFVSASVPGKMNQVKKVVLMK